ncbi:hypothetical protein Ciccas_013623 [Cichlidogyrus casuarinus]|uniref:C2H2-type domain-containing protein n=1 Tax=Cichlidogyrus casuarinus TaxID=1844966 RepID=A0ABD2PK39_9PLAT
MQQLLLSDPLSLIKGHVPTPADLLFLVSRLKSAQTLAHSSAPAIDQFWQNFRKFNSPSQQQRARSGESLASSGSETDNKHSKRIKKQKTGTRNDGSSSPGKQPVTKCYQCEKSFFMLTDLNVHFLENHQNSLKREFEHAKSWKGQSMNDVNSGALQVEPLGDAGGGYPCPSCKYYAKWPTELQKHMMVHSKERPHCCVICGLTYKWKWDLGRHFDKSHQIMANPYKKNLIHQAKKLALKNAIAQKRHNLPCNFKTKGSLAMNHMFMEILKNKSFKF